MIVEIKVPVFSESVSEGTLLDWQVKEGDAVSRGQNLIDIETDKVVLEVPAIQEGVINKIVKSGGEVVTSEEILGYIDTEGVASEAPTERASAATSDTPETHTSRTQEGEPKTQEVKLSPAARRLASETELDVTALTGTAKDNRVSKQDVASHLAEARGDVAQPDAEPSATVSAPSEKDIVSVGESGRPEERVPMSRLRQRIAERLVQSQQTAAILTTFNEVDMQAVINMRKKYQDQFVKEHDVKLGFMSLFTKATVEALKKFPAVNASIDGKDVVYHGYYDIGVAVGSPRGLVVPILRDADKMSLAEIELSIKEMGVKAQEGKLTIEELTGGTFTISNGGVFGSMLSTPILNPPQTGILGLHNITQRPVVVEGEIVIRPMMYLALSYDHRLIDGREAVQFLLTIKNAIEDPARLILQI